MPQMNSDEASIDEPKTYTAENFEEDQRWHESDNLSDIKGDLVGDLDGESRISNGNQSKSGNHTHPDSSKDGLERDPRDESKGPSRPHYFPPIVSGLNGHPLFPNGALPPTSKVSPYHPYSIPNPYLLPYGTPPSEIDGKTGLPRSHPDIPSMYPLPGNLGQIPHPLAPWVSPGSMYPMCTASTMAATMLRYQHPFAAAFSVGTTGASVAANMPRFPLSAPHGMHPSMLGHAGLGNGGMPGMGAGSQHPKLDLEKHKHSKGDHHGHHSEKERKSDRPYVKKPLNAFMLYMKEQRAKVVAECTLKESAAINQILGRKWHSLSRDEQQKYYEMARKERQLHMQLYPGWSARDNYGKRKKRKKEKSQGECTESAMMCEPSHFGSMHHSNYAFNPMAMAADFCYHSAGDNCACPSHYYGNSNQNNNNNNNNNNTQNSKKCRAVFGLDQQHLWCAPCRRKKKCIRYQHDGDDSGSEYEDMGSPSSPPSMQDAFSQRRPNNPFDVLSSTANPLNPQQSIINGHQNGLPHDSAFSGANRPSSNSPPHSMMVKEEVRTSPDMVNGTNNYNNSYSQSTKQHGKDSGAPVQESRSSPPNNAVVSHSTTGNTNSNSLFGHSVEKTLMKQNSTQSSHAVSNTHRTASSSNHHHTKTSSSSSCLQDSGHSSLSSSSGSPNNVTSRVNEKSRLSDQSNSSREYHPYKNNTSGPSTPRMKSINSSGTNPFLPPSSGNSPLLSPNSMGFNPHSPRTAGTHPFMPPFSPYFQIQMAAANFMSPASPIGLPSLTGLSPMMNGLNSGTSGSSVTSGHGGQSTSRHHGSAVEGKS